MPPLLLRTLILLLMTAVSSLSSSFGDGERQWRGKWSGRNVHCFRKWPTWNIVSIFFSQSFLLSTVESRAPRLSDSHKKSPSVGNNGWGTKIAASTEAIKTISFFAEKNLFFEQKKPVFGASSLFEFRRLLRRWDGRAFFYHFSPFASSPINGGWRADLFS